MASLSTALTTRQFSGVAMEAGLGPTNGGAAELRSAAIMVQVRLSRIPPMTSKTCVIRAKVGLRLIMMGRSIPPLRPHLTATRNK
eukprot:scaffold132047_cov43-Prasinocladus_malaysianus.AAC.1